MSQTSLIHPTDRRGSVSSRFERDTPKNGLLCSNRRSIRGSQNLKDHVPQREASTRKTSVVREGPHHRELQLGIEELKEFARLRRDRIEVLDLADGM
jgi:hypothetical protein